MQVKHPEPVSQPWSFMSWADIPSRVDRSLVYLRRLRILQTPWFSIYLHWINEPDADRDPHDHPWNFWSLILRGSYIERVHDNPDDIGHIQAWQRGSLHYMHQTQAHRITAVTASVLTLVITGRRVRPFCFWTPDGLVRWDRYRDDR